MKCDLIQKNGFALFKLKDKEILLNYSAVNARIKIQKPYHCS